MMTAGPSLRIHKYLPLACICFFVNAPGIFPQGLLLTGLLSPFLYLWLLLKRRQYVVERYLAVLLPFLLMNIYDGIRWRDFILSSGLLLTAYITVFAIAVALREVRRLDEIITPIIWMNLGLAGIGIIVRFTPLADLMWQIPDKYDPYQMIRFKGFTYEASYYSTLLTPAVLFSYWRMAQKPSRSTFCLFAATLIPLLMSRSYGSIGCLIIAVTAAYVVHRRESAPYKWVAAVIVVVIVAYSVLPASNPLRVRAVKIATGSDSSEQVRTTDALAYAYAMAHTKDPWFGVGFGEVKDYGAQFNGQYNGRGESRLSSAVADTLATLGFAGLIIRFGLEAYFFYKTRPDRDQFRLSLFIWVFLFQFGGSFNGNIAEYIVWILAFSRSVEPFPEATRATAVPIGYEEPALLGTARAANF